MLKLTLLWCLILFRLCYSAFHSLYRQLSSPVAEPFFVVCNACVMIDLNISFSLAPQEAPL